MRLTEMQRAVVNYRGGDALVAASAGTGKTEVLARRCLALLLDRQRPTSIDRFLVVTFTRAAAAELRERIGRMLRMEAENEDSAKTRAHLRNQQTLLDAAQIGTIDAWCQRLVRSEYAAAAVDPAFTVLEPSEATRLRQEVRDRLLEWVYTTDDPLAARGRAWIESQYRLNDQTLSGAIEQVNRYREHLIDPAGWASAILARTSASKTEIEQDAKLTLITALAGDLDWQLRGLHQIELNAAFREQYAQQLELWKQALTQDKLLDVVKSIKNYKLSVPPASGVAEAQVCKIWLEKRLQGSWSVEFVTQQLESAPHTARFMHTIFSLEAIYDQKLREEKRTRAAYEFSDIQRMALNLLTTPNPGGAPQPTPLALEQRGKLDHILIDEAQDTNAVQLAIFQAIGGSGNGPDADGGATFLVGDIKQSIYGFRRAEPALFGRMGADLREGRRPGAVLPLADNFRSHAGVLAPLNLIFGKLFDERFGGSEYGPGQALRARREELANPALDNKARVHVTLIQKPVEQPAAAPADEEAEGEDDPFTLEQIEREAWVAAGEIRRLLEDGVQVWSRQPDGGSCLRPLQLSDIAVLLRTARGKASLAARALRQAGIDAIANGRESMLDGPEAQDLLNALRLIVNARNEVAMAAYLRGPYVGLTDAQLLKLRNATPQGELPDAVRAYAKNHQDELSQALQAAMQQLDRWRRLARTATVPVLISAILNDTGAECFALTRPAGQQRVRVLRAFCELAESFRERGVGEFVSHLDVIEEQSDGAIAAPEAAGSVRVITIHAAKGLEFPVVFLLSCGSPFSGEARRTMLQLHDTLGAGLRFRYRPAHKFWVDPRHPVIVRAVARREAEEELRLLYVACTRARDRLHLIGHLKKADAWQSAQSQFANLNGPLPHTTRETATNLLDWVLPAIASARAHESGDPNRPPPVQVCELGVETIRPVRTWAGSVDRQPVLEDDLLDWAQGVTARLEITAAPPPLRPPAVFSVSHLKSLAHEDEEERSKRPGRRRDEGELSLPAFVQTERKDGRTRGTAMHRFLRFADLGSLTTPLHISAEIQRALHSGWLTREDAGALDLEQLAWLGQSEVGHWLAEHAHLLRREQGFVLGSSLTPGAAATIVRGAIDVLAVCEDGLHLFDYKTDVFPSDQTRTERLRGYVTQLRIYAKAASAIANVPIARAALILLSERHVVEAPLDVLDLSTIWRPPGAARTGA